jgi:hypothetical protein
VLEVDPIQNPGAEGDLVLNARSVAATQSVVFTGTDGDLTIGTDNGTVAIPQFHGLINAFTGGDTIIVDTTAAAAFLPSLTNTSQVLVTDTIGGGVEGTLTFATAQLAAGAAAGTGGTLVDQPLTCFAAGTRIETAGGLVAVEDLAVGAVVRLADGGCAPVVWIGQRAVNCRAQRKPETVWPVRVRRGAFGANVPVRDLYLSPDHAVFVNEVLVPVKLLINGTSVARVKRERMTYFHVELPAHDVILAEGLTVESYLDVGDRADFSDGDTVRLFPEFGARLAPDAALAWEAHGAAPLVMAGGQLTSVRRVVAKNTPRFRRSRSSARTA